MPALLSDGSRHYNQVRRIHPRDSVAQLDYYIDSSSSVVAVANHHQQRQRRQASSSSSSSSAGDGGCTGSANELLHGQSAIDEDIESSMRPSSSSSPSLSSFYSSALSKILGWRAPRAREVQEQEEKEPVGSLRTDWRGGGDGGHQAHRRRRRRRHNGPLFGSAIIMEDAADGLPLPPPPWVSNYSRGGDGGGDDDDDVVLEEDDKWLPCMRKRHRGTGRTTISGSDDDSRPAQQLLSPSPPMARTSSDFSERTGTLVERCQYFGRPALHQVHLRDTPNYRPATHSPPLKSLGGSSASGDGGRDSSGRPILAYNSHHQLGLAQHHQMQLQHQHMQMQQEKLEQQQQHQAGEILMLRAAGRAGNGSALLRGGGQPMRPNLARLKRRNINRVNRRMLMTADDGHHHLDNPYALSELFSQSEIPGFREIFASDSYLRKFCWIVAFLFMTVLSLNDMTELITEYYEYPITVDVRLRDSARLPFPSVTVCNLNVVRFSALCSGSGSSTSGATNSRFDLTNQIPSELRDKLCGIQVEKKKNATAGDTDISDINNIGITTTTTTTTTTAATAINTTAANSTAADDGSAAATTLAPSVGGQTGPGGGASSQTGTRTPMGGGGGSDAGSDNAAGGSDNKTAAPSVSSALPTKSGAEHKLTSDSGSGSVTSMTSQTNGGLASAHSSSPAPASTEPTRRTTAKGALDLGDFAEPALLLMDRGSVQPLGRAGGRARHRQPAATGARNKGPHHQKRSIRLSDLQANLDENDDNQVKPRPFASSRRVRIRPPPPSNSVVAVPAPPPSPPSGGGVKPTAQLVGQAAANQAPGMSVQVGSSGVINTNTNNYNAGRPNQFPALGIRNGPPGSASAVTPPNAFQNPPPLWAPTVTPTPTSPAVPSSTAFVPPAADEYEMTERQERELQENLTNWLAVMQNRDPRLTWSLGHQFDDMILRCTMKSSNCTHQRSFENNFTPTEGNCFTYLSKARRRSSSSASKTTSAGRIGGPVDYDETYLAGANDGLELVLNLEKNEYIAGSSQVGALVMIHHPSDLGYAASEATFVAPEFTTYIGLKMVNITRLPAPYPEYCVDSWPEKFADKLTRNSTYSQQACLKICLQKTIQSHCHCQSATLPIVELDDNGGHHQPAAAAAGGKASHSAATSAPPSSSAQSSAQQQQQQASSERQRLIICDTRKPVTRNCVKEVTFRAADRVHNCECPPKCQVVRYDKTISTARWPTREDKVSFDRGKMDVNFQNLAKVIVYFQSMTCEEVAQQAVFNAAKLFSALGGIMGMYVGFSFLSVFEIFEVMSRKMWHHFTVKLSSTTTRLVGNLRAA